MFRIRMPGLACFAHLYAVHSDSGVWWLSSDSAAASLFETRESALSACELSLPQIRFEGVVEEVP